MAEHQIPENLRAKEVKVDRPPMYIIIRDTVGVFLDFGMIFAMCISWSIGEALKNLWKRIWRVL